PEDGRQQRSDRDRRGGGDGESGQPSVQAGRAARGKPRALHADPPARGPGPNFGPPTPPTLPSASSTSRRALVCRRTRTPALSTARARAPKNTDPAPIPLASVLCARGTGSDSLSNGAVCSLPE